MPARAFSKIIRHPKLIFWSFVPIVITLSLYSVFITQAQTQIHALIDYSFSSWGLDPTGWAAIILLWITRILLFLVTAITFSFLSNLVACPFNDFLAEQTEAYATPPLPYVAPQSLVKKLKIISIDVVKTGAATALTLISLVVSWIPLINFLSLLITLLLISFQFISYPQTRRGEGFFYGIQFVLRNFFYCLGFGLSFSFLFSIPILSSFCLPLAVVGGTLLVAEVNNTY
jgi:uncharacterized protein involved in cysteine biosynthesis